MDTHISPTPALSDEDGRGAARRVRLPGEPDAASPMPTEAAPLRANPRPAPTAAGDRGQNRLLLGVAMIALATAGGSVFVLSPYNHVVPVPPRVVATVRDLEARAGIGGDRLLAPSASLAGVSLPLAPKAVIQPKFMAQSPSAELSELMKLHAGAGQPGTASAPGATTGTSQPGADLASRPASPSVAAASEPRAGLQAAGGPPAGYVAHEPGVVPERPSAPAQTAAAEQAHAPGPVVANETAAGAPEDHVSAGQADHDLAPRAALAAPATTTPATTTPATATSSGPSRVELQGGAAAVALAAPAVPRDPVAVAKEMRPAPMTPPQQVQVLELVTQVATLVRDERAEVSELRADVARREAATAAKIGDFERRLAVAEAHNAVVAASNAGGAPPTATPVASTPTASPTPAAPVLLTKAEAAISAVQNPPQTQSQTPKRYRLQAASPGLALLAEIDRGGGDGAQLQVQVGDTIRGYGRVKSIAEHGTSWAVTTENGTIQ